MISLFSKLTSFISPSKPKKPVVSKEEAQERRTKFETFVKDLQNHFVSTLQKYETKATFLRDEW